jgi:predicted YcjX-like family ATPase
MSDEFYGFDDEDFDGCEHGKDFSEYCQACEDDPLGCLFPGKCLMPGEHLISECHTAEMLKEFNAEKARQ